MVCNSLLRAFSKAGRLQVPFHALPSTTTTIKPSIAMISPKIYHPQSSSKPTTKSKRARRTREAEQKPKKVNSEMRKHQNRIASRNYREKRKLKLQYLQQLLKAESTGEQQTGPESPQLSEGHLSSASTDYGYSSSMSSPYIAPGNYETEFVSSSYMGGPAGVATTSTTALEDQFISVSQPHHPQYWDNSIYYTDLNMLEWSKTSWTHNMDYQNSQKPSRGDLFSYSLPDPSLRAPSMSAVSAAISALPPLPSNVAQQPQSFTPDAYSQLFDTTFGPSDRHQYQIPFVPNHPFSTQPTNPQTHNYERPTYI